MKKFLKNFFSGITLADGILTTLILLSASGICMILQGMDEANNFVAMMFILAVFLVSRYTNGYFYGTLSSLIGVLGVNYVFTYPYFEFNFTLAGYPITIISMLVVSIITCTMTTKIKKSSELQLEAEREKTRSNLLRAVSHDLRTPLTSILGATSAILDNDDLITKEQRDKLLIGIKEDSQWLIRMVENLLSITRIDAERSAKIIKTAEAVEEVVSGSVQNFNKRYPDQRVNVKVPDELLMVDMDAILIEQVIINLLENAVIHSMSNRPIELIVGILDNNAIFKVIDSGAGIEEQILPTIFEGYFKKEHSDNKKSMGIGLSVCYTIVKAHHGTMNAKNIIDKHTGIIEGAMFTFTLPIGDDKNGY